MKKSDIKLWTPFINQNGHLSICYKITDYQISIINYNGTIYKLQKNTDNNLSYKLSSVTIADFFHNFPREKLYYENLSVFSCIQSACFKETNFIDQKEQEFYSNKLLLIL